MAAPTNKPDSPASSGAPRTRSFVDADGAHWRVYEQAFSDYDRRSGLSLIFSSESAMRRVRTYPTNWFELPESEIMALSWSS